MKKNEFEPSWFKDISSFRGIISTFIIEGNIYDEYPYYNADDATYTFCSMNQTLSNLFGPKDDTPGYDFLFYNLATGFFDPIDLTGIRGDAFSNEKVAEKLNTKNNWLMQFRNKLSGLVEGREEPGEQTVKDSEIIRTAITVPPSHDNSVNPMAVVIDFASRFVSSPDNLTDTEISFFLNLQFASNNAKAAKTGRYEKNTLILVVDKISDIPSWFYTNNPNVRRITVPNPDRATREITVNQFYGDYFSDENAEQKEKYIDLTDGMKIKEIRALQRMLTRDNEKIKDVFDLISIYKYGFKENKWVQIGEKLRSLDIEKELEKRVKGQKEAIKKAAQIIKRSVSGVSGLQHSSGTKPKGIMFLAGATGTGKTELVKAITELLFEDERALIRFDMSEYGEDNSDQKLFGAPPGYVGYGHGGQLTNAVRANPFCVLLFDEIEKASPAIMDKFLQILEDGRMTDGQGNTVYFSETMIFFTSNKGTYVSIKDSSGEIRRIPTIKYGDSYEEIAKTVTDKLKEFFKPEVYGRIGENNFAVFNLISPDTAVMIADKMIGHIADSIRKERGVNVEFTSGALDWLRDKCMQEKYLKSGGRGIGNAIEELYLNLLGEFLFSTDLSEGSTVSVTESDGKLHFEKK